MAIRRAPASPSCATPSPPTWAICAASTSRPMTSWSVPAPSRSSRTPSLSTTDFGAGDEVIYPVPGFPDLRVADHHQRRGAGAAVPAREPQFRVRPERARIEDHAEDQALILNSPQNPTGGILTTADPKRSPRSCASIRRSGCSATRSHGRLTFEGSFQSLASLPDMQERCIISDGASKTWAMTGWRIGFTANNCWHRPSPSG